MRCSRLGVRLLLPAVTVAMTALLLAGPAHAKAVHESPYSYEQTFGSALRLVKVDLGLKVTDRDADWGYVLFEYRSANDRASRGSIELVRTEHLVRVTVQLPAVPSYHERLLVEKLAKKLENEHGEPPKRKPRKPQDDEDAPEEPPSDAQPKAPEAK